MQAVATAKPEVWRAIWGGVATPPSEEQASQCRAAWEQGLEPRVGALTSRWWVPSASRAVQVAGEMVQPEP